MAAATLLFSSVYLLLAPLPIYVEGVSEQRSQVGLIIGAFSLVSLLSRPYVGQLTDALGRKRILLAGALIFAISPPLYILSRSISLIFVVRLFHGLGLACFTTAYSALTADLAPPNQRGEIIGLAGIVMPGSMMVAPAIGATLLKSKGFTYPFIIAAAVALLSSLLVFLLQEPRAAKGLLKERRGFLQVLRSHRIWAPIVATGVVGFSFGTLLTFIPLFVAKRRMGNAGLFFSAYSLAIMVARMPAGWISDRLGRWRVIAPMMALLALALGLLGRVRQLPWLIVAAVLSGLGFGSIRSAADALVVDRVPLAMRGTALGIALGGFDLGQGLGSFLMGVVADAVGYGGMYIVAGGICLLGLFIACGLDYIPIEQLMERK